jgi:uncharacterized protein YjbI with pentapeptide repeats
MANPEHLAILKHGTKAWNEWRKYNWDILPSLAGAKLIGKSLIGVDLNRAFLRGADLAKVNLSGAYLREADLRNANLSGAILRRADLSGADLDRAILCDSILCEANINNVSLNGAVLKKVNLIGCNMKNSKMIDSDLQGALLQGVDLSGSDLMRCNLKGSDLSGSNLGSVDLSCADLCGANLRKANLKGAILQNADLRDANLVEADLSFTICKYANMEKSRMSKANISFANLSGAKLNEVVLLRANLNRSIIEGVELRKSVMGMTNIGSVDLRNVIGLDTILHNAGSSISIDTLYESKGKIPESFLRGCGVPDQLIEYVDSLTNTPNRYYSCFISYSHKDEAFAERLWEKLQANNVRCWYAPHDLPIGAKMRTSIDEAIRFHEKLLIVLSRRSVQSDWVEHEVEHALDREKKEKRLILFPVRIDKAVFSVQDGWVGHVQRQRNIGDFDKWKSHDAFEIAFDRLLRDLKAG